jgi:hypothetical protein
LRIYFHLAKDANSRSAPSDWRRSSAIMGCQLEATKGLQSRDQLRCRRYAIISLAAAEPRPQVTSGNTARRHAPIPAPAKERRSGPPAKPPSGYAEELEAGAVCRRQCFCFWPMLFAAKSLWLCPAKERRFPDIGACHCPGLCHPGRPSRGACGPQLKIQVPFPAPRAHQA